MPATSYTQSMKTAVSLPDQVFDHAEKLAKRLKKSRSQLYREALSEYLARHDADAITNAMNAVVDRVAMPDPFMTAAARRVLARVEW